MENKQWKNDGIVEENIDNFSFTVSSDSESASSSDDDIFENIDSPDSDSSGIEYF